jgi:bifunctional non-homologous end joining protein LigD
VAGGNTPGAGNARLREPALPDPPNLREYREKRDFGATPEPGPGEGAAAGEGAPRFVIQRHDARALHHDLRLERDGALASWAVPKGVPLREGAKRLAVRTEDHPLEYLDFAAVIPEGQYGAGRMTIWDAGAYDLELWSDSELKLTLDGRILRGDYHLVRTGSGRGKEEWLIFRSGKGPPGPPDPAPRFRELRPMLAATADEPFDDTGWAFELKWDGYRALALVTPEGTELRSRNRRGRDITASYPDLADLRRQVMCEEAVLDGEIVVLGPDGRPSFAELQNGRGPFTYMAFDLLYADGEWLVDRPWSERRARLRDAISPEAPPRVMVSDHVVGRGRDLYAAALERGLEGIMAKRLDSPYVPDRRGQEWRKVKIRPEMTTVVGGFTEGSGSRRGTLGALLVGEPDEEGRLRYLSNVGSGFSDAVARRLWGRLRSMEVQESPFAGEVPRTSPRPRWVRPDLRAEVQYAERTPEGRLRAPVFHGLVEDDASDLPDVPDGPFGGQSGDRAVEEGGRRITLTNLDKPYWPREGITKGHLLDHYLRMAPVLVPHLADRPMILKRYPDGIEGEFFFQHSIAHEPDWIRTVDLSRSGREGEKTSHYALVDDPLSLLWLVNLGNIDLNPWQSRAATPDEPTHVLFDLDPADGLPFERVIEAALLVRDALEGLGLRAYPRTSGASGMHLILPVRPGLTFDAVKGFARVVAEALVAARPDLVTTVTQVARRGPRVYLDHNQNGRGRSIASVYSVRPRPGAPVATPLHWDEVAPGLDPRDMTMGEVARRVERDGDLAAPVLTDRQDLDGALARLGDAAAR